MSETEKKMLQNERSMQLLSEEGTTIFDLGKLNM